LPSQELGRRRGAVRGMHWCKQRGGGGTPESNKSFVRPGAAKLIASKREERMEIRYSTLLFQGYKRERKKGG